MSLKITTSRSVASSGILMKPCMMPARAHLRTFPGAKFEFIPSKQIATDHEIVTQYLIINHAGLHLFRKMLQHTKIPKTRENLQNHKNL